MLLLISPSSQLKIYVFGLHSVIVLLLKAFTGINRCNAQNKQINYIKCLVPLNWVMAALTRLNLCLNLCSIVVPVKGFQAGKGSNVDGSRPPYLSAIE